MSDLLAVLREFGALRDFGDDPDLVQAGAEIALSPTYADNDIFNRLPRSLVDALHDMGIERLYQHQASAIGKALDGDNVVLQSPTASGKTLAFQIPVLDTIVRDPNARALMIYPFKALSHDQQSQLGGLTSRIASNSITAASYDGDTDKRNREQIRSDPPNILFTNPDMLHLTLLGHADKWQRFLRNLKWVIVDEMHEYRGYFGSNVSMILRRLSYLLAQQQVYPQFFLSSATCANAKEHAESLTGLEFSEVDAADCLRPRRDYYFVRPRAPDVSYWDELLERTTNAGLACMAQGLAVLAFCPTRNFAEECYSKAVEGVAELQQKKSIILDESAIRVYKGGLTAEARHDIQAGLRDGSIKLAFTTNALEAGIDIGGLDGVILAGFPDNIMSARQRIGRAGRSWKSEAFVLYFARNNPLDEFFAANLDSFLRKPLDHLVINQDNDELVGRHMPCLLYEADQATEPDFAEGRALLGTGMSEAAVARLRSGAKIIRRGFWPHSRVDIRGGGAGMCKLIAGGETIGTIAPQQQFREAFPEAIYRHGGVAYRVTQVVEKGKGREVHLVEDQTNHRTRPYIRTTVTETDILDGRRWDREDGTVDVYAGTVAIAQHMDRVEEVVGSPGRFVRHIDPAVASSSFENAHACWIEFTVAAESVPDGVTALQHLLRLGALFTIPFDAHDMFPHAKVTQRKIYVVESYPGGIGIAREVLANWQEILREGIRFAEACSTPNCTAGCPNCIIPPRSSEDIDKASGIVLARELLRFTNGPTTHRFAAGFWEPVSG